MFVGYASFSTQEQDPAMQLDALNELGCQQIFTDKAKKY
jgi:DNA invertase Pin-like site-specific DNA recombinase